MIKWGLYGKGRLPGPGGFTAGGGDGLGGGWEGKEGVGGNRCKVLHQKY